LDKVDKIVTENGYCVVAVSEGAKDISGKFLADSGQTDQFGHVQLGGAVNIVQSMIRSNLKLKTHGALLDYCQRSGRHIASRVDVEQAIACGQHAVAIAKEQLNGKMVTLVRESDDPYQWSVSHTDASNIAKSRHGKNSLTLRKAILNFISLIVNLNPSLVWPICALYE